MRWAAVAALITLSVGNALPNTLVGHAFAVDGLYRAESAASFTGAVKGLGWNAKQGGLALSGASETSGALIGSYTSRPVKAAFDFHELLPSWNIRLDESDQGYRVALRISRNGQEWSPWFHFGNGGTFHETSSTGTISKDPDWGVVDVDYLCVEKPARWFQYRVELQSTSSSIATKPVELQRFFAAYRNTAGDKKLWKRFNSHLKPVAADRISTISVPYRSQRWVNDRLLSGQICCPTCISMVLESYGIDKPTVEVAQTAYDKEYDIFGAWPRASQTAASFGCRAWVQRFATHDDIRRVIAQGTPLMASIRAAKGEVASLPYGSTEGHLILLRGCTPEGDYIVNDPYAIGPDGAERIFSRQDIEAAWLNKGGVGIVIKKPELHADR